MLNGQAGRQCAQLLPNAHSAQTQCELVALSLVCQFRLIPLVLTDSLSWLQLIRSWACRSELQILSCFERRAGQSPTAFVSVAGQPEPPTLEKIKAHDEARKNRGNAKSWGNEAINPLKWPPVLPSLLHTFVLPMPSRCETRLIAGFGVHLRRCRRAVSQGEREVSSVAYGCLACFPMMSLSTRAARCMFMDPRRRVTARSLGLWMGIFLHNAPHRS